MNSKVKKICIFSIFASITFCLKICMASLPNIEPVTLTLTLYTMLFGLESIYIAVIYIMLEILVYGFSIWSIGYLYIWIVLILIVNFIVKRYGESIRLIAVYDAIFGLIFGALYIPIYLVITDFNTTIAWWIAGIPYDLIHGVSNYVLSIVLLKRLYDVCKGELNV